MPPEIPRRRIWTVGHTNHSAERFVELLARHEIRYVVDVRSYPYSGFAPQFDREHLPALLAPRGTSYAFFGAALGGRPSREEHYDADGHALYGPMAGEPAFEVAISRLVDGAARGRLALMCSCGRPAECHRRLLVGKVLAERGVQLQHILPDGTVHAEDIVCLGTSQETLFESESEWRSTRSVSHRRRLSTSSGV